MRWVRSRPRGRDGALPVEEAQAVANASQRQVSRRLGLTDSRGAGTARWGQLRLCECDRHPLATQQEHPMKTAPELTQQHLTDLAERIQALLYLDRDAAGTDVWDPDKPWDPDTLDGIAQTLARYGLVPTGVLPATGR